MAILIHINNLEMIHREIRIVMTSMKKRLGHL